MGSPADEPPVGETSGSSGESTKIGCIGKCRDGAMVIGAVEQKHLGQGWRKVKVAVDSGAAESVIPADEVPEYPPVPLKDIVYYQTASGETIANEGEQTLPVIPTMAVS